MAAGKHRFRLRRKSMLFGGERFFYLRPPFIDPPFHFLRIALFGSLGWPLQGPVYRSQYLPHMSRVIVNTAQTLDNNRYAGKGPQIGVKPVSLCSHSQCLLDPAQLLRFHLRFPTCSTSASQGTTATPLPLAVPATYALAAHLQFVGNPRQNQLASGEHSSRSLSSICHCLEIPTLPNVSFHAAIVT
jgi:hypothetical protein